ncbi:hypothetical protein BDD12DRAFT_675388, partial [Trichophaea hybrida]
VGNIPAVTGLAGHTWGSWRGIKTGQKWLRDFFQKNPPSFRTMIYDYNSHLDVRNIEILMDYGRGFLEEIRKVRRTD